METIKLNKKKKKIIWKRIFGSFLIIVILTFFILCIVNFRIGYKYYSIDENGNKLYIGLSSKDSLLNTVMAEEFKQTKEEGHQIADYSLNHIINKKWVIIWKENKNDDEVIKSVISDSIYIIVYAFELDLDGQTYILPEKQGYKILSQLKEINKDLDIVLLKGVYVNKNEILDQQAIDLLISNYKEQYQNN